MSEEHSSEGVAAELVSELAGAGELVEESQFTIDAQRAFEKLRSHQLLDANAYILLLIEAAVLSGLEAVHVSTSAGGIELELGELGLGREQLEQLFAAVFSSLEGVEEEERGRRRALKKLALACNAVLQLEPLAVELELRWQGAGLCLRMSPAQPTGVLETIDAPQLGEGAGARLRVRRRVVSNLMDVEDGRLRDLVLIHEHCKYARVPVFLAEARISQSLSMALHTELDPDELSFSVRARKRRKIELEGRAVGWAGLCYGREQAELRVLTNSVLAETIMLDSEERRAAPSFMAIVDLDLPKDLAQAKLLRGPAFTALLEQVWAIHDSIAPEDFGAHEQPPRAEPIDREATMWSIFGSLCALVLGVTLLSIGALADGGLVAVLLGAGLGFFGVMALLISLSSLVKHSQGEP